jgi:light-regulated signal transduction histidine kinase (bacteriophytochrome)/ActR/RegA family two-component response regulator
MNTNKQPLPDGSECGLEPIHIPGCVQPHGALLAVLSDSGIITHASANLDVVLGRAAETVIGLPLADVLGDEARQAICNPASANGMRLEQVYVLRGPDGGTLHLRAHQSGRHICLDMEPVRREPGQSPPVIMLQSLLEVFVGATSRDEICAIAVHGLKSIAGYDRVMAYRFCENGDGEVIAEAREPHLEPYLGLRYPASDIPPQARRLYQRHRVSTICDTSYNPVALLAHPTLSDGEPVDLTHSSLRSVSPIHRQYLRNMQVAASMTVAVVSGQKLWGLLLCHHGSPRVAAPDLRSVADMIGQYVALRLLDVAEVDERHAADLRATVDLLTAPGPLPEAFTSAETPLLRMLDATGVIVRLSGENLHLGRHPKPAAECALELMLSYTDGEIVAVDDLGRRYPELAGTAAELSGALLMPLAHGYEDAIIWLRPEHPSIVRWAGNPAKPSAIDSATGRPSPRTSFAPWVETVTGRSSSWSKASLELAQQLRSVVQAEMARRARKDLRHMEVDLEQRVVDLERVKADLEAQKFELIATATELSLARDAAEAASSAKSDFLAMMSHEIRTPMTSMTGMLSLLRDTPLNEEQKGLAEVARSSAAALLAVINDILDFSKLEAGRLQPEAINFSLERLTGEVGSLLDTVATDKGLGIEISLADDVPKWLTGDPNRIRQVLLNLANNAIKFAEKGSVRIAVSHRVGPDDGIELRVEVIDEGPGIAPDVQARLFSPFTQADSSVSRKYGGTGLGLAICKQLCLMMDGTIGVDSAPGCGSTFWFTVRCAEGSEPRALAVAPRTETTSRSLKILVAEDNALIQKLIGKLLAKAGHQAEIVPNGVQAVTAVEAQSYDLVLMDMQMPELDGISAARKIRQSRGPMREVPIIALTGNALVGQRESCLAAGMNDYLSKPFEPEQLYAAINRLAGAKKAVA